MGDFLKELGKHFLNLALAVAVSLVFQPVVQGHFNLSLAFLAGFIYLNLLGLSFILMYWGNRFEDRDKED